MFQLLLEFFLSQLYGIISLLKRESCLRRSIIIGNWARETGFSSGILIVSRNQSIFFVIYRWMLDNLVRPVNIASTTHTMTKITWCRLPLLSLGSVKYLNAVMKLATSLLEYGIASAMGISSQFCFVPVDWTVDWHTNYTEIVKFFMPFFMRKPCHPPLMTLQKQKILEVPFE